MKKETIKELVSLNRDFYERIGKYWNNQESFEWSGWDRLTPMINNLDRRSPKSKLRVLDLGCGNGRFLQFIKKNCPDFELDYFGLDFSDFYLEETASKEGTFIKADLIFDDWPKLITKRIQTKRGQGWFDLIVLFGVVHHIPGITSRQNLFHNISKLLKTNGIFVFTKWNFASLPRLQKRILDLTGQSELVQLGNFAIKKKELEKNDYILDWVKYEKAYRFAHDLQNEEIYLFLRTSDLELVYTFEADGSSERQNRYYVGVKNG
jgi:tRNA (uracil-5-)-methyltransferase TRM9